MESERPTGRTTDRSIDWFAGVLTREMRESEKEEEDDDGDWQSKQDNWFRRTEKNRRCKFRLISVN